MRLVLASASPRRTDLLRAAGYTFLVDAADVDERPRPGELPTAYVERVARAKADTVARRHSGSVVLGADTCVVINDRILGKPADEGEADAMLQWLSGREHEVLTGVAVRYGAEVEAVVVSTSVRFLQLSRSDVAWYMASGEADGKAGGYAIQGLASRFVERIEGSYSNVVGLPVAEVAVLLARFGVQD